jgi:hypothetical protein
MHVVSSHSWFELLKTGFLYLQTSRDSSVFTGTLPTRAASGGSANDGVLDTPPRAEGGTVAVATYTDSLPVNATYPLNCESFGRRHVCSEAYIAARTDAELTLSHTGTFAIGSNLTVVIRDGDRNTDFTAADTATVAVRTPSTVFNLTLRETGPDTGTFTGIMPTRASGTATPPALLLSKGHVVTVNYTEVVPARVLSRTVTANFLGDLSQTFNVLLSGGTLRITLVDLDLNTNPSVLEQVSGIVVTSVSTGQREVVTLMEKDSTSGTFVGVLPTHTDTARAEDFSGVMNVVPGAVLSVAYADAAPQQTVTRAIRVATIGSLTRSPDAAFVGGELRITVTDPDVDRDPAVAEQLLADAVRLSIRNASTDEPLLMRETGLSTGVFTGAMTLTSGTNDPSRGLLGPVQQGGYVLVKYRDEFPLGLFELALPVFHRGSITVTPSPSFDLMTDTLTITVVDNDLNKDPRTIETMGTDGLVTISNGLPPLVFDYDTVFYDTCA